MDAEELAARLQALEDARAQDMYNKQLQSFMTDNGALVSNDEALGRVLYDEVLNRVGPDAAVDAVKATASEIIQELSDQVNMLQDLLKNTTRATEDAIDAVKDQAADLSKSLDKLGTGKEEAAPAAEMPAPDAGMMPPDIPMDGTFGDMPDAGMLPPDGAMGDVPPDGAMGDVPPDAGMMPPAEAPMDPNMVVSDERMKDKKADKSNKSECVSDKECKDIIEKAADDSDETIVATDRNGDGDVDETVMDVDGDGDADEVYIDADSDDDLTPEEMSMLKMMSNDADAGDFIPENDVEDELVRTALASDTPGKDTQRNILSALVDKLF